MRDKFVRTTVLVALLSAALAFGAAASASAEPGWQLTVTSMPTNFAPGDTSGNDRYTVRATDVGSETDGTSPIVVTDTLPSGMAAKSVHAYQSLREGPNAQNESPLTCNKPPATTITCTYDQKKGGPLSDEHAIYVIIHVEVDSKASGTATDSAVVSGGGARLVRSSTQTPISSTPAGFGFQMESSAINSEGSVDTQAGSHPYEYITTLKMNTTANSRGSIVPAGGLLKDVVVDVPPGLLGNPQVMPQCSDKDFHNDSGVFGNTCPPDTQVGVFRLIGAREGEPSGGIPTALYNLVPPAGYPAAFGFVVGNASVILKATVKTGGDYAVRIEANDNPEPIRLLEVVTTFWGIPGDHAHDPFRYNPVTQSYGAVTQQPLLPFLRLPTSCNGPLVSTAHLDSWSEPGVWATSSFQSLGDSGEPVGMTGCGKLDFSPKLSVQPGVGSAGSPLGYDVRLTMPQNETAEGLAEADLQKTVVTLPDGVTISPSAADGLGACAEAQIALHSPSIPTCPDDSKVGDVSIETPLVHFPLLGSIYIAQPYENPFNELLALYVVAEDSYTKLLIKLAGRVQPDPVTGQLTVTFDNTPQQPFTVFKMRMLGGARASLSNPPLCGRYTTTSQITSWASEVPVSYSDSFSVLTGVNNGPCMNPLPFDPGFSAGTVNPEAGEHSAFTMNVTREDGQQTMAGQFQVQTPPGLLGILKSVTLCQEPTAAEGKCGPESQIGHVTVGTGPGPDPYYVHGIMYLTGKYKGAPYGLSIVTPAVAGPFNLGNVIVRAGINIDPNDSHLYVTTEPIPTVIDGIPIQVRSINATVDRSGFMINPTNCSPMAMKATIASVEGVIAYKSSPFRVGYCGLLSFKPSFTATTNGKTSRQTGANLDVKLSFPPGKEANLAKVKVDLPKQLPSRLTTLQKACVDSVFEANPGNCPAASRIGYAKVATPILGEPLAGPVFFVSHGGAKFPDLVIVLQGDGLRVDVVGATNINKVGITSTSFRAVEDVPVTNFELYLPQGPDSALAANGNLCKSKLTMPTIFIAQNGAQMRQSTQIVVTGCGARGAKARNARAARIRAGHRHHSKSSHRNRRGNR